jgi:hypothetical protein
MADQFSIAFDWRSTRYNDAAAGIRAFAKKTNRLLEPAQKSLSLTLRWYLTNVATAMAKRHGGGYPGGTSDYTMSRRSGRLVQSIEDSVRVEGTNIDDLRGYIGSDTPYARIQEVGGTVTPKASKYLTIPLPAALNGDGTPKLPNARAWKNTFVATSKAGNLIIFQKVGAGKIVPLYVLKTKVVIPPRMELGATLRAGMSLFQQRAIKDMLKAIKDDVSSG